MLVQPTSAGFGYQTPVSTGGPNDDRRRLTELDVAESIVNAVAIYKTLRSRSPFRQHRLEYLHIIQSTNLDGLMILPKGNWLMKLASKRITF